MSYIQQFMQNPLNNSKNRMWVMLLGVLLTVLGLITISTAALATLISIVFLGIVITIGGIIVMADACKVWWGQWSGFLVHFFVGLLYFLVGMMLINEPFFGMVSLTLLLGVFYLIAGGFRMTAAMNFRLPHWRWGLFNGIVTALLGLVILLSWPAASLYVIGLLIGVDILFSGITFLMMALTVVPHEKEAPIHH